MHQLNVRPSLLESGSEQKPLSPLRHDLVIDEVVHRDVEHRLQRSRWARRFVLPETERDFRTWLYWTTRVHLRAGVLLGLGSLLLFVATQRLLFVPGTLRQLAVELLVLLPLLLITLALTTRAKLLPLATVVNGVNNALFGLTLLWIGIDAPTQLQAIVPLIVVCAYFHFTIVRMPPIQALLAVSAYGIPVQVLFVWAGARGLVEPLLAAYYVLAVLIAMASGAAACFLLYRLASDAYVQEKIISAQRTAIEAEQRRSEALLASILPGTIVERLKRTPEMVAELHDDVTVLFADLVGFTGMAAALTPAQLIERLNHLFREFDEHAAALGVEKIKTIGDAYLAVAGVPGHVADHARRVAELALRIQQVLLHTPFEPPLSVRIGIHSGPVVAGVIGTHKFAYDVWGDTVNTAARMESHGVPGEIHVSAATRELLGDAYEFVARGPIEIKGKGTMHTWFLHERGGPRGDKEPQTVADERPVSPAPRAASESLRSPLDARADAALRGPGQAGSRVHASTSGQREHLPEQLHPTLLEER